MPPTNRESSADGGLVPAWVPGNGETPESLQVATIWTPHVYVNGTEALPSGLGVDPPLSALSLAMTVTKRSLIADRQRFADDEIRGFLIDVRDVVDPFVEVNAAYLPVVFRAALARRGFPVG